jgi:hypothetical protein
MPPFPPDVTTSHEEVTLTTHRQSLAVDTLIEPLPPAAPIVTPRGSIAYRVSSLIDGDGRETDGLPWCDTSVRNQTRVKFLAMLCAKPSTGTGTVDEGALVDFERCPVGSVADVFG